MADHFIEIHGLGKSYVRGAQSVMALANVNLVVSRGDFVALMGPSGSGKTTLLNLIGGLDRPSCGHLRVAGSDLAAMGQQALARWRAANVGFVFQFYHLLPVLTAHRNVELALLLTDLSAAERNKRAGIALELVGLGDRAQHRPAELSGGQQQRVAIARALVTDPLLLVCDEPTGDLDRANADDIMSLLQRLNRELDKTIVMVTHDPRAAARARWIARLEKGVQVENEWIPLEA